MSGTASTGACGTATGGASPHDPEATYLTTGASQLDTAVGSAGKQRLVLPKQLAELPQSRTIGTFVATPAGQPVERGLYRFSRSPQVLGLVLIQLGVSIVVGSWLAITCLRGAIAFASWGRSKSCLGSYGKPY